MRSSSEGTSERLSPYTSFVDCTTFWNIRRKIQTEDTITTSKEKYAFKQGILSKPENKFRSAGKPKQVSHIHSNLKLVHVCFVFF